jgi:hypothetical protein
MSSCAASHVRSQRRTATRGPDGLTDLIQSYGVNMKKLFEHNNKLESQMTAFDGKKYFSLAITRRSMSGITQRMWMNMKWLERSASPYRRRPTNFTMSSRRFKENDANGNGDATD